MVKLVTFLLLFGASTMVAAPATMPQPLNSAITMQSGEVSEQVADALLGMAATEWHTQKSKLWQEYRSDLIDINKLGVTSTGEEIYELDRKKTGGSLTLILDVEAL